MKKKDISANGALPAVWLSMVPIVVLVTLLYFAVGTFGTDTLSGASQLALLFSGGVAAALGIGVYRLSWTAIERSIVSGIGDVMPSVLILLVIGALSGAWMVSGIVPGFIYYGMKIIHPKFFLATACAVCAVVSIMTGSSWTTIATIGLALIGIGRAQGFEDGVVAGAIISGSYFGDKMSPLSDTTVLTASVSNTPLFTHIRYMMWTTVPAMILTLAIFTVLGISHETVSTEQMAHIGAGLASKFDISPWVFVVPVLTVVMIVFKTPSLVALFISASLGAVFALVFQTDALKEVAAGGSAIKGAVKVLYGTASFGFADKTLADLTESGGMAGMLNTVWLIICAMVFGGVMKVCRMLEAITLLFMRLIRGRTSMVSATVASGSFFNVVLADQYLAILLTGSMYMPIYRGKGYESRLLSRTTEDAVTVTSPLVPWSTCGMTQATMLSVPTIVYLPYSFFNLLCPLFTLALAATGIGIFRKK
ncbi:MAG: sodium:proton antiporter [Kiritimatiellae bacterium]|nr:sodium:proton antiporter [Kiritimatiellia bacterium]